jgi:hypothetical protein
VFGPIGIVVDRSYNETRQGWDYTVRPRGESGVFDQEVITCRETDMRDA